MKISKRIAFGALLAAALLIAVALVPSIGANPNAGQTKSEKALEYISQKHAIPQEQLMVVNEKEANFPLSNKKLWSVKILDPITTETYIVDIDEAGSVADIKAAKALEIAKYKEKYGKKEVDLHEKLQKLKPDDTVEVGIWLSSIADTPKPEREISEREYNGMLDTKRKAYAQKEKPVIDTLKAKNINVRYASQYAPLIYAEVPAKLMAEIENIPEVEGIYLAREFKPALDMVASTEKVQPVWNAGVTGSGIKVAIVEHGKIVSSHPNLATGIAYNPSDGDDSHATQVAGIVATVNDPTYKGISYGVPGLLSANAGYGNDGEEARFIAATEWAIASGANILSNSWGTGDNLTMKGIDRYFDHVVWSNYKTVTAVAGNNVTGTGNVVSPGLAYNVITVGGFDDKDTSTWSDDAMWGIGQSPGSSWRNPISRDREKPEVVAVATHGSRTITSLHPWYPYLRPTPEAGTSYASPAVAAEAALLMQARSWLTGWPETVKAVIMASAVHNLEGSSRLSEYDGAGGIDISNAYNIALNQRMLGNVLYASSFPRDYPFTATAGQKVRVVITWDSHPDNNHPPTSDTLQSDLDIYIYDPAGNLVTSSISFDANFEIVEFTAPATGNYKARATASRFDGTKEYVGFAYTYV
ncbi:MAG: S8 family serine peptidase [Candidatus Methanoperedens sp.]|nr:S8 family serine peptidase [Candidatus Methanoperedens sp.]